MTTTFKLTAGATTYELAIDGTVATDTGAFGTWSIDGTNQIVLKPSAGGAGIAISAVWKFNESNQLCLYQGTTLALNFHSATVRPQYRLANNLLEVRPSQTSSFDFRLTCKWEIDDKVNLKATMGTAVSLIDGFADDKKSRFVYWFKDKQAAGAAPYLLVFSGEWQRDESVKDAVRLKFKYGSGANAGTLQLPADARVDPLSNQLYIEYKKDGVARSIGMRGSVQISKSADLIFTIAQQSTTAGGIITKETLVTVQTSFQFNKLKGNLELYVGKTVTPTTQKLVLRGDFALTVGQAGLTINFDYEKESGSGQRTRTAIAVDGTFALADNGAKVTFKYKQDGTNKVFTTEISNVKLGKVRLEGGLNITTTGGQKGVYGFIGISF